MENIAWVQWCTQKDSEGAKISSQLCDVTNQLYGECRRRGKSKSWANPKYSQKNSFAFAKIAWFCLTFFVFRVRGEGHGTVASTLGTLVPGLVDMKW